MTDWHITVISSPCLINYFQVHETLTHSEKVKEAQKKFKGLADEVQLPFLAFPFHYVEMLGCLSCSLMNVSFQIFTSMKESQNLGHKMYVERTPVSYKHQQDVIDLQQEYYTLYNTLPKEFRDKHGITETPASKAEDKRPGTQDIEYLRADIGRILKALV